MRRQLLVLTTLTCLLVAIQATAYASSTKFSQNILPLNCVFEAVNDGLGTIYYLTPAACGVVTPPPRSVPQTVQSSPASVRAPSARAYNARQPAAGPLNAPATLPWQPIVAVVQGNGTVVVNPQHSSQEAGDTSLPQAVGNLIGNAVHPTPAKVAVGATAGVFIAVVLALALL